MLCAIVSLKPPKKETQEKMEVKFSVYIFHLFSRWLRGSYEEWEENCHEWYFRSTLCEQEKWGKAFCHQSHRGAVRRTGKVNHKWFSSKINWITDYILQRIYIQVCRLLYEQAIILFYVEKNILHIISLNFLKFCNPGNNFSLLHGLSSYFF